MEYQAKENEITKDMNPYRYRLVFNFSKRYFRCQLIHEVEQGYSDKQAYHKNYGQQPQPSEVKKVAE